MSKDIIKDWKKYDKDLTLIRFVLENGGVSRSRSEGDAKSIIRHFYMKSVQYKVAKKLGRDLHEA
jgi:hypothetical protein